jgi:hypothetical protein
MLANFLGVLPILIGRGFEVGNLRSSKRSTKLAAPPYPATAVLFTKVSFKNKAPSINSLAESSGYCIYLKIAFSQASFETEQPWGFEGSKLRKHSQCLCGRLPSGADLEREKF